MRLYPLLYSYPIGVNAPILDKKLKIEFNCSDYAQDNGCCNAGKKSTRFRIVLTFKGYSYYR